MPFGRLAIAQFGATFREYEFYDFGHIADGGVSFNLVSRASTRDNPSRIAALRDHLLATAVRDSGAGFSGEHGIGRAHQAAYDELTPGGRTEILGGHCRCFCAHTGGCGPLRAAGSEERDLK